MRLALIVIAAVLLAFAAAVADATSGRASARASRACGTERWPVKTLTDPAAGRVNFTPRTTTVDALRALPRPSSLGARGKGVERTTYRIKATLIEMKLEDDSDVHLVVAQPGRASHTMIVEFPASSCTRGASAGARRRMSNARRALEAACGAAPSSRFEALGGTATITGVGFFDFKHGQRGVAPNAIELHPATGFSTARCG